jgi:hypothetical protein
MCYFWLLHIYTFVDYIHFSSENLKMAKKCYFKPKFYTQNLSIIDLAYFLKDPDPESDRHQNDADPVL